VRICKGKSEALLLDLWTNNAIVDQQADFCALVGIPGRSVAADKRRIRADSRGVRWAGTTVGNRTSERG
jgi:hypothetical protein